MRRNYWELDKEEINERAVERLGDHVDSERLLECLYRGQMTWKAFQSRVEYLIQLSHQDAIDSLCEETHEDEHGEELGVGA